MSYTAISRAANDGDLQQRCIAAAAAEGHDNPAGLITQNMWNIASNASIADPYSYAVGNRVDRPGYYDDVVTDAVILAVVQALIAAAATPPA